jgi:hypothetical protein
MAFREVLVTQVREVLRAWLAGAGKRPAARRAGVDVKTASRYIHAAQAAGLVRDEDESQLTDELLGQVVAAVRPARPAGHGASWEALAPREAEITAWVKAGLTLVKIGELLERSGTVVRYRTLARFAASECGYSSSRQQVTVPVADGKPGEEVQLDFGYLRMISDGESTRPPVPAGPPAARTGHHPLPWQQRLPRLGCVSQTHHDRGSRTSTRSPDLRKQPHGHELQLPYHSRPAARGSRRGNPADHQEQGTDHDR